MFIREYKTKNKKTGTIYITHSLVESYLTDNGPRQRIILHLGTLTIPKNQWRDLSIILESKISGQQLIEYAPELEKIADIAVRHSNLRQEKKDNKTKKKDSREILSIDLNSIHSSEYRSLGAELVANEMWNKLDFEEILSHCRFTNKEIALAKIVITGRLISPSSDFDTWKWLKNRTSMIEMTSVELKGTGKNQIYEIVDRLLENKETIEHMLKQKTDILVDRSSTIYLYDLTNTYFEGACLSNKIAARGKCKSKRTDCPLVTMALMVDSYGFPIFSEIYSGNQSEPETLKDILDRLEKYKTNDILGMIKPTVAMDRGIATEDNIKLLKEKGYQYVVIERKNTVNEYLQEFEKAKETFDKIDTNRKSCYGDENNIYLKKIENDDNTCRILCLSEGKERKEKAISDFRESRFIKDMTGLKNSIEKKKYVKNPDKIHERIGRIKQKYSTVAKNYDINTIIEDNIVKSLDWAKKEAKTQNSIEGCYVIETTHNKLSAYEIWTMYMTLSRVESAFRALKSDLGFRPVFHQNAERTKGHLFVSVLAYHMLIYTETILSQAGDNRSWVTIRKILSTHHRSTIIMTDENENIHHLRISGMPEFEQKNIYDKLNIKDPLKRKHKMVYSGL